ncbi:WD40 repeat-like protein [Neolentinus lepideus HHB14362 ss-1]|uniref:WD40 repeat-like protein n=1 Tax=Neolentinus lepideus HHB14362 ss-1 TaxID=1314782 RepID=A0A165QUS9_9AGAM|nr:WD40 repeat-like protein [Neolentinus lepideus HHB14362 ss-1]
MPDSFFASKKRKRARTTSDAPQKTSKFARTANGKPATSTRPKIKSASNKPNTRRDEELSSASGSEDSGLRVPDEGSGDELEDETPAEKRLRLAKLYLEGVKEGLKRGEGEFDAGEIDRELISERLRKDVLEEKGRVWLWVADQFDFSEAPKCVLRTRGHKLSVTSAVASDDARFMFTAGKEGSIIKWDLRTGKKISVFYKVRKEGGGKGKGKEKARAEEIKGHTDEVLALALSGDGRYLVSGGKDRKVVVWDAQKGEWVKAFGGHKDTISGLAFRNATQQLYSSSFDRTVKLFDLSVMGYVETLFGHQDSILGVDALKGETAVSVGGRDRTVRFWKIVDQTQLVFRGGGRSKVREVLEGGALEGLDGEEGDLVGKKKGEEKRYVEGSMECVAMVDESTFLSGGDSGSICLWTIQKKKAIFTQALAHGLHEMHSETEGLIQTPRWVTSIATLRYSDLFASGSWEGSIRIWKLDDKLKSFSLIGSIPAPGMINSLQFVSPPKSALDEAAWAKRPSDPNRLPNGRANGVTKGPASDLGSLLLVAGVGQEMRFGRWMKLKNQGEGGEGAVNCALVVALHPRTSDS